MKKLLLFAALFILLESTIVVSAMSAGVPTVSGELSGTTEYSSGVLIEEDNLPTAPDGYVLSMVVNGTLQDVKAGDYTGCDVTIYVLDEHLEDLAYNDDDKGASDFEIYTNYVSALMIDEDGIINGSSAIAAAKGVVVDDDVISGGLITIKGNTVNVLYNEDGSLVEPDGNVEGNEDGVWDFVHNDAGIYNGITITNGNWRIKNVTIDYSGNGGDDFHIWGSAIAITGTASTIVDNVNVTTKGVIATALSTAVDSEVLVENSKLITKGTDNSTWYKYNEKGMTSAAWVLGDSGTVRSTNALGNSIITYYNTFAESNGWGVYSNDEATDIKQFIVNSTAYIPSVDDKEFEKGDFGSGYAVYGLNGSVCTILGCTLDTPDLAFIIAGGDSSVTHTIGPSSHDNLESYLGEDNLLYNETNGYKDVKDLNTVIYSDNFGILWHSNSSCVTDILPGTEMNVGDTVFMIKGGSTSANSNVINVDHAIINDFNHDGNLSIVHLMETDDAGQTDEISLHHDYKWAICAMFFDADKVALDEDVSATVTANFSDMELKGDFWNSVYTSVQELALTYDNCEITGSISSADAHHRNVSFYYAYRDDSLICTDKNGKPYETISEDYEMSSMTAGNYTITYIYPETDDNGDFVYDESDDATYKSVGYGIYYTNPEYIGKVDTTASEPLNNPVSVTLSNGSVWNVTGECWVSELVVDDTSRINGVVTELDDGTYYITPMRPLIPRIIQRIPEMLDFSKFSSAPSSNKQRRQLQNPAVSQARMTESTPTTNIHDQKL